MKLRYNRYSHQDTFEDFAMPKTYALVAPVDEFGGETMRVYTPNPWVEDEIHFWNWSKCEDGIWRRSHGGYFTREEARKDWIATKTKGWIPRDVIADPLNGGHGKTWDEWASHFSGGTRCFYGLANVYRGYPRKEIM